MSTSITTTTTPTTTTKSMKNEEFNGDKANRYQQLVQKKAALEKKLNEKYEQLHQLCQKEADLIGNLDLIVPNTSSSQQQAVPQFRHQNSEINKLLIEKQKQQQQAQASLGIINDPMQSKTLRRTHKQAYEISQQKIEQLNENINLLQRNDMYYMTKAQDDIDLHRSDNRFMKNALAMCGNNVKNLHLLNTNSSLSMSERRNSMKSTTSSLGSSNTFIIQSSPSSATSLTSLKTLPNNVMAHSPRTRQDGRYEFEVHKTSDSPTPSTMSMQHPVVHHQLPLCSQSLKNIKINTENHSPNIQSSYHNVHAQFSPQMQSQQQQHSPQFYVQNHHQANGNHFVFQPPTHTQSHRQHPQAPNEHKFLQRLHSFNHQMQYDKGYLTNDMKQQPQQQQPIKYQASPNHYTVSHSAGLGGYWMINEHNQRIWVADSKYPLSPPNQNGNMAKKSNSLGNFDFIHKENESQQQDALSISSGNSNEHKKKEKIWCETSLDSPPQNRKNKPRIESPTPSSYSAADYLNNNHHQFYENTRPIIHSNTSTLRSQHHHESNGIYVNPLANPVPNLPPKSKLRHTESTRSTISNRDFENNIVNAVHSPLVNNLQSPIQIESPINVTIIQEGSWKPYKEEVKSYEISDFYKYSEKYRQQQQQQKN
ncbi:hypothetical protein PVAND_007297 [Polypedilum vanderplanki]|uniref:Cytohesin Ubiquitin Protein Inducing domain-containing protein n=1 Tax=Polypedilum vanderplanki TaxID=319348 RepID=A0A9J6C613_POLVA|nr:hypothetical protein PVAND_007297 [Polypedilum vanderplanki]